MWLTLEGSKNGHDCFYCTILLPRMPDPYVEARARAKAQMGARYVGDPARHIKRGDYVPQEIHRADVGATFARELARLASEQKIVVATK